MVKFIHTSDWQVGMKAAHVGLLAAKVRDERIKAIERVLDVAEEEKVDLVIVAGDQFEDNAVDRKLVTRVVKILASHPSIPIHMIPGNHDPLTPDSVYNDHSWEGAPNVTVHQSCDPVYLEDLGVVLHPCPITKRRSLRDPTSSISVENDNLIHVGIAHGNLDIPYGEKDNDFPIPQDVAKRYGLAYLALGHWHSTLLTLGTGVTRVAYSGTPETTKFGENDSGNVLVVEIASSSSVPEIKKVSTGGFKWFQWSETINDSRGIETIKARVKDLERPQAILLELTLEGVTDVSVIRKAEALKPFLDTSLAFVRMDASGLRPEPTSDELLRLAGGGPVGSTAEELLTLSASETSLDDALIARRALNNLYFILEEAAR